jgi:hypothetical protein
MPAPFYNAIKGTTSGTPGTGAFTPNAAASGFRAWSLVPNWIGLVRYEDGSSWELTWSYWNGTTLSRASTQLYDSSSGSAISLTSAATAAMIVDGGDIASHFGSTKWGIWEAVPGATAGDHLGTGVPGVLGTATAREAATTNYLTEQVRIAYPSATTANAQSGLSWSAGTQLYGVISTSAGRGGYEVTFRFGSSSIPTGPRLFAGFTDATFVANTGEPSAFTANYAVFAKDSTDTNIQLLVNSNVSTGTKTDTGIPLTANGWYEASIWCEPGSNKVYALLIRVDTGAIWYGTTTTDVPANGALVWTQIIGSLSSTTGTAMTMEIGQAAFRTGA